MKVILFISSLSSGGAERVTVNLANYWVSIGWNITIITLRSKTKDFYKINEKINRIDLNFKDDKRYLLNRIIKNILRIKNLRSYLKENKPDIVLSMMDSANLILSLSALGLKVVTVGSERIHPPEYPIGRIKSLIRKYLYGRLNAIVVLTEKTSKWISCNTNAKRIEVIPNPVILPIEKGEPYVKPPKFTEDTKILLSVGRLHDQKNFDILINTFSKNIQINNHWKLIIIGEGPKRTELETLIKYNNLSEYVILPGRAGNISDWYKIADLYMLTSRYEGFPNSLVEAMAHGLAVIAVDCDTGPSDIIRHNIDGLIVPKNNFPLLEKNMHLLMNDENKREIFSKSACNVNERFGILNIHNKWYKLFYELKENKDGI